MNQLHIVMYHYIRDLKHSRYPEIKGLDAALFRRQIEYLKTNFQIVTMEEVIAACFGEMDLPEKAMLLTFDDGYIDNYTFAFPILEEFGLQGSFFIPGKTFASHQLLDVNKIHFILAVADIRNLVMDLKREMEYYRGQEYDYPPTEELFQKYGIANRFDGREVIFVKRMLQTVLPERLRNMISSKLFAKYAGVTEEQLAYELYMTEEQIRTMKRHGMFVGVHGYDHYWLGNLPPEQMKKDISLALDTLDEFIDRRCWVMNYPYGSYNQEVVQYIKSQGACVGLTTEAGVAQIGKDEALLLPRFDCNDFPPKGENYLVNQGE